jgi:hypothetical protein
MSEKRSIIMQSQEARFLNGKTIFKHRDHRAANRKGNLHKQMVAEAECIVKYNWSDVVYADREKLKKMPDGGVAVWCIYEMGSYLCPMYQSLNPKPDQILLPLICHVFCRFYPIQSDRLSEEIAKTARYYLIRKSGRGLDGSIEPFHLADLRSFVQLIR